MGKTPNLTDLKTANHRWQHHSKALEISLMTLRDILPRGFLVLTGDKI